MSDWRSEFEDFMEKNRRTREQQSKQEEADRDKMIDFMVRAVLPAFQELKDFLGKHGKKATHTNTDTSATIEIEREYGTEFKCSIGYGATGQGPAPYCDVVYPDPDGGKLLKYRAGFKNSFGATKEDVINTIIHEYMSVLESARP